MTNFEALKQMPINNFANMVFHVVNNEFKTRGEFEDFLNKEIPANLEPLLKENLENLQPKSSHNNCSSGMSEKKQITVIKEKLNQTINYVADKIISDQCLIGEEPQTIAALADLVRVRTNIKEHDAVASKDSRGQA